MKSTLNVIKSRGVIVVAGLGVSILLLVMTARTIDWAHVRQAFADAVWLPWVPIAIGTYMVGMLLRGLRLRQLVGAEASVTTATASNIIAVGYAVNNILPARLGEFARAGMLAERTGLPYALALTVTFLERLLDGLTILCLFVVASLVTPTEQWMRSASQIAALIFAMVLPVVVLLALFPQLSFNIANQLSAPLGRKWHHKVLALTTQVSRGFSCLRDASSTLGVLTLSFLIWIVEGLMFAAVMPCFKMALSPVKAMAVMAFTNLGILIPSTPGYLAVYHRCCSEALQAVTSQKTAVLLPGFNLLPETMLSPISQSLLPVSITTVDPATAISYAVVVHLIFYATVTIWGVIAMVRYGVELGATAALAWDAKPVAASELTGDNVALITSFPSLKNEELPITLSPFWLALSQAMCPPKAANLSSEEHEQACRESAEFLCVELSSLPVKLVALVKIGMGGFRVVSALTGFNLFEKQSADKRATHVNAWSFGKIALTRKLFKPLRSIALLAYFENPAVQRALDETYRERHGKPAVATREVVE